MQSPTFMGTSMDSARSYEPITLKDLERLAAAARADTHDRFLRKPRWRELYQDRLLAVALCQGAALHYLRGDNGIKDFDVWSFYAAHPEAAFPPRWRTVRDFGDSKFGRTTDSPTFVGRRVDLIGRSIDFAPGVDPRIALQRYLKDGRTETATLLAMKAVILLEPAPRRGEVIWPPDA